MRIEEALERLCFVGITDDMRVLRKWLMSGHIKGTLSEDSGLYEVDAYSLQSFIIAKTSPYETSLMEKVKEEYQVDELQARILQLEEELELERTRGDKLREKLYSK